MIVGTEPPADSGGTEDELGWLTRVARDERGRLAAIARHEGLDPEAAVDCVQDALCTLLDRIQAGPADPAVDPIGALVLIVRNLARNQRRRHARAKPHLELAERDLIDAELVLQESLLARAEETVRLRACVAELCEIQRAVVTLRLLEERPGEDVAQALGVTKNHVAVLLHRAKFALETCMAGA